MDNGSWKGFKEKRGKQQISNNIYQNKRAIYILYVQFLRTHKKKKKRAILFSASIVISID